MKKIAVISCNAPREIKYSVLAKGYTLVEVPENPQTYKAVASHPDINMFWDGKVLYMTEFCYEGISGEFQKRGIRCKSCGVIGEKYPENVGFNGAVVGRHVIHNFKYTDPEVLAGIKNKDGKILINVKQGYSKCSICIVDDNSVITSDKGIARELLAHKIDGLLISEGGVELEGMNYGFIGGATGSCDDEIFFCGDITEHPDYLNIKEFIESRGKKIDYVENVPLTDVGTVFFINC